MSQLEVGTLLDQRYRVETLIAHGGMSSVYRCMDLRLGRPVAAKVLDDRLLDDPISRERFRREARSMAQLSHPCLVNVYDTNSSGDHVFLIMELITGGTLRELLAERGPMPPHAATAVMRSVLTALAVAHEQGMVHRDIKPDNILINGNHQVKLADFGLVRAASHSHHTSDQIIGTVSYLSPEQVDGSAIGPASDVYSAGIVLFELLTGETPFHGETPMAHAYARLTQDVPAPSTRIDGVPHVFDELVARACARNPEDRFSDAAGFLHAVDAAADSLRLPPFKVPVPRNGAAHRATTIVAPQPAAPTETREGLFPDAVDPAHYPAGAVGPAAPSDGVDHEAATAMFGKPHPQESVANDTKLIPPTAPAAPIGPPIPGAQPPSGYDPYRDAAPVSAPPQTPPAPPTQSPVTNRSRIKLAVWLTAIALIVASVAVGGWWFGSGRYGEIPSVLGMGEQTALSTVQAAGFSTVTQMVYHDSVAEGEVVGTKPPFGQRVPRGDEVAVLVSLGRPTVPAVPFDHDPVKYEAAMKERTLGWSLGAERYDDTVPAGQVLDASPRPGTAVPVGSMVSVILSKGPAPVVVPSLVGDSVDNAKKRLQREGLEPSEITEIFDGTTPGGRVISTQPSAGVELHRGDSVSLVVSNAITIPDVSGLSYKRAVKELGKRGISVESTRSQDRTGSVSYEVIAISPAAGEILDPTHASVTLDVASHVRTPRVVGKRVGDAQKLLAQRGIDLEADTSSRNARIVSQSPRPGGTLASGEPVRVRTTG